MCRIPQNSGRINVMHSLWINIGAYNWAGFGLVFVTDWAGKNNNLATLFSVENYFAVRYQQAELPDWATYRQLG